MDRQYFVTREGRIPQDVVELVERTDDEVAFFPAGGGFQYRMPAAHFDATHREVSRVELESAAAYSATFDIDGMFGELPGYSFGKRWNGWACPYFPRASCDRIVAAIGNGARYDEKAEAYLIPEDDSPEIPSGVQTYPAEHIMVAGKWVRVWAIGSGSWMWEEESTAAR
jgi:hypothetical protein